MNDQANVAPLELSVVIRAPIERVWDFLTDVRKIPAWMGESEMALEIETDWVVGEPFVMRGFLHHSAFANTGTVVEFEPVRSLAYTHLSSLSGLPDEPASHTTLRFLLNATADDETILNVGVSNFPTPAIFKHLQFYWRSALESLRQQAELNLAGNPEN